VWDADDCTRPHARSTDEPSTNAATARQPRAASGESGTAYELVLTNARVVMRDTMFRGTLHIAGGRIAGIDTVPSNLASAADLEGDFLIPGLVDIHTDNLEKHLEPRPGVAWPSFAALVSHDRQIADAGVTTVLAVCRRPAQRMRAPPGVVGRVASRDGAGAGRGTAEVGTLSAPSL
jgi:alpha-D-ribose 1-methylphosphonate 5-triphosphate diphosphatase